MKPQRIPNNMKQKHALLKERNHTGSLETKPFKPTNAMQEQGASRTEGVSFSCVLQNTENQTGNKVVGVVVVLNPSE